MATTIAKRFRGILSYMEPLRRGSIGVLPVRNCSSDALAKNEVAANPKAIPLADSELCAVLMKLLKQAYKVGQITKGSHEVWKALHRDKVDVAIFAADTDPFDKLKKVLELAQNKNIPYVFVPSKYETAHSCRVLHSPVIACSLFASNIQNTLDMEIMTVKEVVRELHLPDASH
eukprot:TRINITY_DN13540_c0_g1_i1.p1 TRINITY_DN13540_c0_g1~~TRINITY_DN13540_c0_g1_i1.p1  ORF type:complete len:174 (+),score=23.52 TRINITY_DN13540_c0_g1_i1:115-636(+)